MHSITNTSVSGVDIEQIYPLVGVPLIEPFESFASWITRAALSQGVLVSEFLEHLGIKRKVDMDIGLTRRHIQHAAKLTGQNPARFWLVHHMFSALRSIDTHGENFLMFFGEVPCYRYCPVCLHEQSVSHFPLHWRFRGWRHCPLHNCMMDDRCKRCGLHVRLRRNLMTGGIKREGVAYFHHCYGCEHNLSTHWKEVNGSACGDILKSSERIAMDQGRAVLSALYHGYFSYVGQSKRRYSLKGLLGFERNGSLPHFGFLLDSNEILRRRNTYASDCPHGHKN